MHRAAVSAADSAEVQNQQGLSVTLWLTLKGSQPFPHVSQALLVGIALYCLLDNHCPITFPPALADSVALSCSKP